MNLGCEETERRLAEQWGGGVGAEAWTHAEMSVQASPEEQQESCGLGGSQACRESVALDCTETGVQKSGLVFLF